MGNEISPTHVSLKELAELLSEIDKGLKEIGEDLGDETQEISRLSLERLEAGSYTWIIEDPTAPGLVEELAVEAALLLGNTYGGAVSLQPRLVTTLRNFNHRHQCRAQLYRRKTDTEPLIEFAEAEPPEVSAFVEETTTVFGVLERVGGTIPRAWLRLRTGKRLVSLLPEDRILAQGLAHHLYREIGLAGRGIRDLQSGDLIKLFAEELTYVDTPITESFQKLEQKIGRYWSDADVMAVIREERGEYGG